MPREAERTLNPKSNLSFFPAVSVTPVRLDVPFSCLCFVYILQKRLNAKKDWGITEVQISRRKNESETIDKT